MKKFHIEIIIFLSGAIIMILEIIGARVLAPYVGTSIFVWSNLIGVILGSLSLGYWLGGRIADNSPTLKKLSIIILCASAAIFISTLLKDVLLYALHKPIPDIRLRSLVSAIVLFSLPSVALGMITPYAVKLRLNSLDSVGKTVGNLFALSSLGSITGTFLVGFILIPLLGSTKILLTIACILLLCSLSLYPGKFRKTKVSTLFILLITIFALNISNTLFVNQKGTIDIETSYNRVWIYDSVFENKDPIKIMRINEESNSARFLNKNELVYPYLKFFRLAEHFNPNFRKTLMIGGAAYTYPLDVIDRYPLTQIDIVEIDPQLVELAKSYFRFKDDYRINITHTDGRSYINHTDKKYDVFLVDAFKSLSVLPFQLTTQEAIQKTFDLLNNNGVALVNIITSINGEKGAFLRAEYATYKSIFPQVYLFPVEKPKDGNYVQNIILVALKSNQQPLFSSTDNELNGYLSHLWKEPIIEDILILTDDFAPVEHYISKAHL